MYSLKYYKSYIFYLVSWLPSHYFPQYHRPCIFFLFWGEGVLLDCIVYIIVSKSWSLFSNIQNQVNCNFIIICVTNSASCMFVSEHSSAILNFLPFKCALIFILLPTNHASIHILNMFSLIFLRVYCALYFSVYLLNLIFHS